MATASGVVGNQPHISMSQQGIVLIHKPRLRWQPSCGAADVIDVRGDHDAFTVGCGAPVSESPEYCAGIDDWAARLFIAENRQLH
jgi:hypothetical protein